MADDDANLPADYDLIPVDHTPQFADAPVPKAGQTVPQPNVMGDISSMPGKVASAVGDVTGVSDAYKAATGQMTPEEAQMFALGALPMLAGGPEAKVAGEAVPLAQRLFSDIRPASENLADVVDFNFLHGRVIGDQTVPISSLSGGTSSTTTEANRVSKLVRQMSGPNGYIERPIVDDAGNVIEGQHRLDALRQLGIDQVPVTVIKDLERGYNTDAMKAAIKQSGVARSDHVNQLMDHALNAIHEEGTPQAAAVNTSIGGQWEQPYQAALAAAPPQPQGIRAYHGSPYDFNQFDLSKIGTGEGAQAYGHGLYFAENPAVAADYKNSLSRANPWEYEGKPVTQYSNDESIPYHVKQAVSWLAGNQKPDESVADLIQRRIKDLSDHAEFMRNSSNSADRSAAGMYDAAVDTLKRVDTSKLAAPSGKTYEVNINADPEHFLDWDKPLSEQHPKVQEALAGAGYDRLHADPDKNAALSGRDIYETIARRPEIERQAVAAGTAYKTAGAYFPTEATEALRDAGIPGIKYLDQGSRGNANYQILSPNDTVHGQWLVKQLPNGQVLYRGDDEAAARAAYASAPKPTSNYVVFNDKLIDIVKKYGLAGLVAGGASHFSTVPVDHQPDFPDQNGMADGGTVDDATDAPTDPNNSIAPLATALNQAVPNFDPEAAGFRPSTNIEDVRNKPLWRKAIEVITRKPLPGDLTNYAKGGGVKATKTQANYRGGTAKKRCGICSMFQPPRGCSAVRGVISPQALCDFYEPKKAEKKNDVKIDVTHDGPWMSCMSIDGATMYRNKNIPATANIKGETVDVDDMLLHHEVPEREDLENLIAEFKKKFNRDPNTKERKGIYLKAHNRSGTPNEREHAREIGVDWKSWSAWCRGEESKIEKMKFTNQPKDADVKPIPHSHDELEAMDHASAA